MHYIQLHDDSYMVYTSKGIRTIGKRSFNYYKIKKLLENNGTEEQLNELLVTHILPNGIYEVYSVPEVNKLYYVHLYMDNERRPVKVKKWVAQNNNDDPFLLRLTEDKDSNFVGVYASEEDIIADWPEYFL